VTTSTEIAPPKNGTSLAGRIAWLALICATLFICYFSHLGAIGFVGPDEPRYAWIARDMAETGDWITPRLYGKPWFEKPPLYYWGAALSFKLFGVSEAAARLPSAVSALLATLVLAWLAWRLYGADTARWLLLFLPTTVGMIGFSHAAATDMPFSAMLTIAMVCAAVIIGIVEIEARKELAQYDAPFQEEGQAVEDRAATPWTALLLFGFFLGLAVLAKGPAALILCGGAVFLWALFTKRWRDAFRLLHPAAIVAFCVTALPWYILCARRNPDFLRIFILEHNFKRFLTPEFQHIQPWWYYGAILPVALLPWTATLLWTLVAGSIRLWQKRHLSSPVIFFVIWSGFCVAFFTLSKSKLPGYILPAIPSIAVVLAHSCATIALAKRRSLGFTCLAMGAMMFLLIVAVREFSIQPLRRFVVFEPVLVALVFVLALANLFLSAGFLLASNPSRRLTMSATGVIAILCALGFSETVFVRFPLFVFSADYLARQIRQEQIPINDLTVWNLRRSKIYGLNFYLHANLGDWNFNTSREFFVITDGMFIPCRDVPASMTCTDLWMEQERLDSVRLLHLTPKLSASRAASGKSQ